MTNRPPILDRIDEALPAYGPGQLSICKQCVVQLEIEKLRNDAANKIADKVQSMSLPVGVLTDELRDLQKLRRGQK